MDPHPVLDHRIADFGDHVARAGNSRASRSGRGLPARPSHHRAAVVRSPGRGTAGSTAPFPESLRRPPGRCADPRGRGAGLRTPAVLGNRVLIPGAPFDVTLTASNGALVTRGHAAAVDVLALDHPRVARTIAV